VTLEVRVEKRFPAFVLAANIEAGRGITALFGRSGAGKTSVVNMIGGLVRPDHGKIVAQGRVLFDERRAIDLPPRQRRIGYVFQDGRLFPHLSVHHNLLYGRRFTPKSQHYVECDAVIELLGIAHLLERRPASLSGGERQRVAIGRALLVSPRLLLMDEPLASLDAQRKGEILPYIERLRDEMGIPIVYVSHAIEEVVRLADTLVVLSEGKVAASGTVPELMGRLDLHPLTGRYEAGAVIEARIVRHDPQWDLSMLAFAGGELIVPRLDQPLGTAFRVRIRARDVALSLRPIEGISIRNCFPCQVVEIRQGAGPLAEVRVNVQGTPLIARLTRHAVKDLDLHPGDRVFALVKSIAIDRHSLGLTLGDPGRLKRSQSASG
jgi:molybdate transport system ATP-binding protein